MDLKIFFDPYELRARIAPSLIVSLPAVVSLYVGVTPLVEGWPSLLGAGTLLAVASYGFSFVVRHLGKSIERDLWTQWDGAPSIRFARWRDGKFGDQPKQRIHQAVAGVCGIQLMTRKAEAQDPLSTDKLIEDAFRQVRAILQARDKDGLWYKHNAEYGFVRNLLGSRKLFLSISVLGGVVCGFLARYTGETVYIVGAFLNLFFAALSLVLGWWLLPPIIKDCADRYAETCWMSLVNLNIQPVARATAESGSTKSPGEDHR